MPNNDKIKEKYIDIVRRFYDNNINESDCEFVKENMSSKDAKDLLRFIKGPTTYLSTDTIITVIKSFMTHKDLSVVVSLVQSVNPGYVGFFFEKEQTSDYIIKIITKKFLYESTSFRDAQELPKHGENDINCFYFSYDGLIRALTFRDKEVRKSIINIFIDAIDKYADKDENIKQIIENEKDFKTANLIGKRTKNEYFSKHVQFWNKVDVDNHINPTAERDKLKSVVEILKMKPVDFFNYFYEYCDIKAHYDKGSFPDISEISSAVNKWLYEYNHDQNTLKQFVIYAYLKDLKSKIYYLYPNFGTGSMSPGFMKFIINFLSKNVSNINETFELLFYKFCTRLNAKEIRDNKDNLINLFCGINFEMPYIFSMKPYADVFSLKELEYLAENCKSSKVKYIFKLQAFNKKKEEHELSEGK